MEFLLPHLDEFILDFDAEEALLQAQVLAAGQVQTQASILAGPGLGPYPVRHNRSLPNAALKARGRQPKLAVSGVPAAAVEPVQLDSQLDALRREIARLEQQKQKQVATKAVPARPVSSGSAAARVTQKGPNVPSPGKPPGTANDGGAARQNSRDAQRQPSAKRARVAPAQAKPPTDASRPDTPASTGTLMGAPAPGATAPVSLVQPAAGTGGPGLKQIGSKRSADEVSGGLVAQQQSLRPRQQQPQPQQRPQQRSNEAQQQDVAREAAGASQAQPAMHPSLSAAAPPQLAGKGNPHPNDSGNVVGSGQGHATLAQIAAQQPPGGSTGSMLPTAQRPPSQLGPAAPRRQARATGQRTAASTSSPSAIGGSSSAEQNGAATAGMPTIQPVATSYGATSEATVRVSITSTADGSPTKSGANSKRARPAADGASGPGNPSEHELAIGSPNALLTAGRSANATQHAGGHATSANGGITDICPEAQLAANEFLLSFMSQIGSEEQGRGGADPAVALTPPQHQGLETSAEAQEHYGQQHPEQSQHPNPRSGNPGDGNAGCLGAGTGQNEHGGHASIGGKPLAERAKNAPTPGCGGGASARRAAAERTSAAVQRLRRKSSGVAGTELLLRTATSSGMAANGAAPVASDVTAAADGGPPSVLVCATSPTYADGVVGGMAGLRTSIPQCLGWDERATVVMHTRTAIPPTGQKQQQAVLGTGVAPTAQTAAAGEECALASTAEGETEIQGSLGAVSSPVAPQTLGIGLRGSPPRQGAQGLLPGAAGPSRAAMASGGWPPGLQTSAAAHMPRWVQPHSGNLTLSTDPGIPAGAAQQLQRQLDQRQQQQRTFDRPQDAFATSGVPNAAGIMGVGAATGTSAPRASTPAADALRRPPAATAGTATPAANVLPPLPMPVSAPHTLGSAVQPVHPGAPSGMLPSATASQFPYPQLSHALGPRPLPGGSFPSAFLPGPPPGMQCRPSQPGVFLGAMQPPVSLVEVDVLARKELILLKWQMLQEIAVDLEAEWTEVCLAHNRLRMLSLTQAQHGRSAAAAVLADGPPGRSDAPQIGPPFRPEIALPALHPHPVMRGHATFHPFTQLSQQQLSQRQEQQTGGHQGPKQQSASGQEVPLLTPAPGQSVNVQLAAPRPMALQDVRGGRFLATPPAEMQTAALENGAGDRQPNGARHGDAPAEARGAPDPAQLHLRSGQCPGGEETCPNSQFHVPDKQSRHPDQREREPVQPRAPERELGSEPASRVEGERAANTGPGLAAERGPLLAGSDISTAARNSAPVERHPNGDPAAAVQQHDAAVPRALAHRDLATAALRLESHGGGLSAPLAQQPWLIAAGTRSPPPGASLPLGATCISANGPAVRMAPAAAPQVGERQPGSDLVGGLAGSASAGVGFTGVDGPQQHSRQHAGVQQQQVGMPQAAHDCDTAGPRDGAADAWRSGGDPRVNQAFLLTTGMEDQAAVSTVTYEDAARGIGQAMLSGPARHLPALTCGGSADGRTTGDGRGGGPGPSVQQRTSVWMPWEHAGAPEAPPGLGEGSGEARSNVVGGAGHSTVAAATHSGGGGTAGWGDGGEGDSGQSVGVTSEGPPFTGLSFKLSAAPIAGRRVATMRAQLGTPSPQPSKGVIRGPKRVSPSLSAVVPAPIVQPRGRLPAVAAGPLAGNPAPASAAPAFTAPNPAAVAPVEPPVRVQSAPQVLPARRPSGGSPGAAIAAATPRQEQQASQRIGSSDSSSGGLREVAAAIARPATQTARHVQAPRVPLHGLAAAREETAPRPGSFQVQPGPQAPPQPGQDRHQPSALAAVQVSPLQQQQQHAAMCPQLSSPGGASAPPLYHRRGDIVLTGCGAFGTTGVTIALDLLTRKYMSPLNIFRSYSGGAPH